MTEDIAAEITGALRAYLEAHHPDIAGRLRIIHISGGLILGEISAWHVYLDACELHGAHVPALHWGFALQDINIWRTEVGRQAVQRRFHGCAKALAKHTSRGQRGGLEFL